MSCFNAPLTDHRNCQKEIDQKVRLRCIALHTCHHRLSTCHAQRKPGKLVYFIHHCTVEVRGSNLEMLEIKMIIPKRLFSALVVCTI